MKKLVLLFGLLFLLTSCECNYDWERNKPYYQNTGLTLMQEDLYGTWQSSDLMFGDYSVKEIVISRSRPGYANVNLQQEPYTGRWNATYQYVLDGKFLYFQSVSRGADGMPEDGPYKFKVLEVYTCEIVLQNCYNSKKATIAFRSACNGY
jgi:hypothetical protein